MVVRVSLTVSHLKTTFGGSRQDTAAATTSGRSRAICGKAPKCKSVSGTRAALRRTA